jgi:hypothetical protein
MINDLENAYFYNNKEFKNYQTLKTAIFIPFICYSVQRNKNITPNYAVDIARKVYIMLFESLDWFPVWQTFNYQYLLVEMSYI